MANRQSIIGTQQSPKRPLSVTLLAWVVLIMALLGWLRFYEVLRQWQFLQSLTPAPPVWYLALIGLVWGLVGTALLWGLVLGRAWAPHLMRVAALLYTIYYWLDRLLVADSAYIFTRWPFALGLNIALLILTLWVLARPKAQLFFQKNKT
jgi:hypothetical protein